MVTNRLKELAGINELDIKQPGILNIKILTVFSRMDGGLIDYSFDCSQEQKNKFIQKYNINIRDDGDDVPNYFGVITIEELLKHFKSEYTDFNLY